MRAFVGVFVAAMAVFYGGAPIWIAWAFLHSIGYLR